MILFLQDELKPYFTNDKPLFDQLMALRGECYRNQKGRLTQRIVLGDKAYFIKQHQGVGWREIFKNLTQLRLPVISAKTEWLAIQKLQSLNVRVPKIAAYGERGMNPANKESFILMEEIAPAISLEDLVKDWQQLPPAFAYKKQIIESVGKIARILHENGVNHRDFYICHFLLCPIEAKPTVENLFLIDLHRAQIRHETPLRWIIKDLSALLFSCQEVALTKRDLLRFVKVYTGKSLRETFKTQSAFWQKVKLRGTTYRDHTK